MRFSLEEFRAFCAFFFLLQRRGAEAAGAEGGANGGRGAIAPMLKLIFAAADVGSDGGTCGNGSCDLIGDGRLGKGELRNMLLVLIKEGGSLSWLQPKFRADPRFKHMLADYCKSPLNWTADAALHELITFDAPPALATWPHLFTDTSRLTWDGLSAIIEAKRRAGGETTIEALTRRWMDAAIEELSRSAPAVHPVGEGAGCDERGWGEADAGSDHGEELDCDFDAVGAMLAGAVPPSAQPSASSHVPPAGAPIIAARGCYAAPGFPLPVGLSAGAAPGVGTRSGPLLRVDNTAAKRLVRLFMCAYMPFNRTSLMCRGSLRREQVYEN